MSKSIFQIVLEDNWNNLGNVIKRHYFLKPFYNDNIVVSGEMSEIYHSPIAKLLYHLAYCSAPWFRIVVTMCQ